MNSCLNPLEKIKDAFPLFFQHLMHGNKHENGMDLYKINQLIESVIKVLFYNLKVNFKTK